MIPPKAATRIWVAFSDNCPPVDTASYMTARVMKLIDVPIENDRMIATKSRGCVGFLEGFVERRRPIGAVTRPPLLRG